MYNFEAGAAFSWINKILAGQHCKGARSYRELAFELLHQNGTVESLLARGEPAIA